MEWDSSNFEKFLDLFKIKQDRVLGVDQRHSLVAKAKISEFLTESSTFSYVDVNQNICKFDLNQNQLAFTYCQVPIIYELKDAEQSISVSYANNKIENINGDSLSKEMSAELFSRSGKIKEIKVCFERSHFLF